MQFSLRLFFINFLHRNPEKAKHTRFETPCSDRNLRETFDSFEYLFDVRRL